MKPQTSLLIRRAAPLLFTVASALAQAQASGNSIPRFQPIPGTPFEISAPKRPLKVAEENEIPLIIHSPGLTRVWVEELSSLDPKTGSFSPLSGTGLYTAVLQHPDGSSYFRFTPVRLGEVGIFVRGEYADGGFSKTTAMLDVGPSALQPAALRIALGGVPGADEDHIRISLDNPNDPWKRIPLFPVAWYYDLRETGNDRRGERIDLNLDFVSIHIEPSQESPVIAFDKSTRLITPLRAGEALLQFSYGGLFRNVCVQIISHPAGLDYPPCLGLFPPAASTPLSTTWKQDPDHRASPFQFIGFHADRLRVAAPDHPLEFGQPVEIPWSATSGSVQTLRFEQRPSPRNPLRLVNNWRKGTTLLGNSLVSGVLRGSASTTFQLVPATLGDETIAVSADFDDGGHSERYFRIRVLPSPKGLTAFRLLSSRTRDGRTVLVPELTYAHLANPVTLPTMQGMDVSVEQSSDLPVIRVGRDGVVHELRPGQAVIVAKFGAITARLPVRVALPLTPDPTPNRSSR
jgi:hypothetical protein